MNCPSSSSYHYAPMTSSTISSSVVMPDWQHINSPDKLACKGLKMRHLYISEPQRPPATPLLDEVNCRFRIAESIYTLSKKIFEEFSGHKIVKKDLLKGVQAIALYYAYLHSQVPRSISEICSMCSLCESTLTKADKIFREVYRTHNSNFFKFRDLFECADAEDLISRQIPLLTSLICITIPQQKSIRKLSIDISQKIRNKKLLVSKSSGAIACVAIFMATESIIQRKLSKAPFCNTLGLVTSVTLQTMLKQLENHKDPLLSAE